ncbi:hypothetical protein RO03_01600 [Fusobacterium nucleatum subsp. nucleatum]|uniref:Autotransporter domain-containing protein n=1 Tax=Fusobacterium nucleatum subsp. nucleatum TaxID=76856 RepID=A0A117MWE2_FUSNC|nr:hypothetical protein [Fusobacterium nucleatum]KUL98254.1 hypothetical protein RO03_01600 [Fusobacterium nucleatum subsp. nucleatum]
MYIKKCGILGLILSISVFAEMEVENDGRGFLNANVNLSGVNLKEKKNILHKDSYLTIDNVNSIAHKSFIEKDLDKDIEITPYLSYLSVDKVNNVGGGVSILNNYDETVYGINFNSYKMNYSKEDERFSGNKHQINLIFGIQKEDERLYISPIYMKQTLKNKSSLKNLKKEYIGLTAAYGQDFYLYDLEGKFSYDLEFNAIRENKEKVRKTDGKISLKYQKEYEIYDMSVVPSIETSYKYTFKDSSKKEDKEKLGIKVGVTAKKETFEVFLGGEFRKSLNNGNYESVYTTSFKYKF